MTNTFTLTHLDLPTLHRHAIGFDRMFDELNRTFANSRQDGNYPPYNIAKLDDTHYVVEIAVDRKSTRLNSSHTDISRMPSSA